MADQQIYNDFSLLMKLLDKNVLLKTENTSNDVNIIEDNSANNKGNVISNESTHINKKLRCAICKIKINAVDALVSSCKCDKKHCAKHRMPETHNC